MIFNKVQKSYMQHIGMFGGRLNDALHKERKRHRLLGITFCGCKEIFVCMYSLHAGVLYNVLQM